MTHAPAAANSCARRFPALMLMLLVVLQAGCAAQATRPLVEAPPDTGFQSTHGTVAVVATTGQMPEILFPGYARSKGEAAAKNGGKGLLGCLAASLSHPIGVLLWAIAPDAMTGFCVTIGTVGAGVGAAKTPGAEEIKSSEATMSTALRAKLLQDELRKEVVAHAGAAWVSLADLPEDAADAAGKSRDYRPLAARGIDSVLEVALTRVFAPGRSEQLNPPLPFQMLAHVRVIRTRDNGVVFEDSYEYRGRQYTYTEWTANNAERLAQALATGYDTIARDIADRVFLLYPYPNREPHGKLAACGLAPLTPEDRTMRSQPALAWQEFPRPADIAAAPADMARIRNVRYDLVVGTGDTGESLEVVYRRDNLPAATHLLDLQLPRSPYFWSARAHFELDGRQRVTEWSAACPLDPQLVVGTRLFRLDAPVQVSNQ
jgi:hypothetical protein